MEFVVPPVLGILFDRWSGTSPLATIAGMILGFIVGMMHVLKIAREKPGK
jgi:F0F1-type ATP synthase assembly protein I